MQIKNNINFNIGIIKTYFNNKIINTMILNPNPI